MALTHASIAALLSGAGITVESARPIDHGEQFRLRDAGNGEATVNLYRTGRLLVQGADAELAARVRDLLTPHAVPGKTKPGGAGGTAPVTLTMPSTLTTPVRPGTQSRGAVPQADMARPSKAAAPGPTPAPTPRIGMDESGKGDYFGPLVAASALVRPEDEPWLAELGVRDCKEMGDREVVRLAATLRKAIPCEVVVLLPPRYNELYAKFRNLNTLLAWAHARALETLLARAACPRALCDRFADPRVLEAALGERGRAVTLEQRVRAESDPAVAAASVLARGEFLRRLALLSRKAGVKLPPGAGPQVEDAARRLAASGGLAALAPYAKLHFKTTGKVTG